MAILEPHWLAWLWACAAAGAGCALGIRAARRAAERFYGPSAGAPWAGASAKAVLWGSVLLTCAGLAAIVLGLARPGIDPVPRPVVREGRDIVFLIDVSRSMLAADLRPSRLERAKLAAQDVIDSLRGDRVAVIAFAGTAVLKCPLTTDYGFARMILDDLSPDSVSRGGTAIGDALRLMLDQVSADDAARGGGTVDGRFRDAILLTDGEDHETDPVSAATEAGARGVRIIALGLGSSDAGAPVPAPTPAAGTGAAAGDTSSTFLRFGGEPVRSRMNPSSLRTLAEATPGGVFLNVGTGNIQLDQVYAQLSRGAERRALEQSESVRYTELFQVFLSLALAALLLERLIGGRHG